MSSFTSETTGSKKVAQLETGGVVVLVHNGSLCKKLILDVQITIEKVYVLIQYVSLVTLLEG